MNKTQLCIGLILPVLFLFILYIIMLGVNCGIYLFVINSLQISIVLLFLFVFIRLSELIANIIVKKIK